MRTTIHRIAAALIAVAALIGITSATSNTAHAQCSPFNVTNTSGCSVVLVLYDAAGTTFTFNVPAMPGIWTQTVPTGFSPIGAVSKNGTQVPFSPAPPQFGCTACMTLAGVGGGTCCVQVCFGPAQCGIGITGPCGPPCIP